MSRSPMMYTKGRSLLFILFDLIGQNGSIPPQRVNSASPPSAFIAVRSLHLYPSCKSTSHSIGAWEQLYTNIQSIAQILAVSRHVSKIRYPTVDPSIRRPISYVQNCRSIKSTPSPPERCTANVAGQRLFSTTRPRQADVTLTIDGKEVTVPQGMFLLVCFNRKYVPC